MKEKIEKFLRKGFKHCFDTELWEYNKRLVLDEEFLLEMTDHKENLYIDFIELRIIGNSKKDFWYDEVLETLTFDELDYRKEKTLANYILELIECFRKQKENEGMEA